MAGKATGTVITAIVVIAVVVAVVFFLGKKKAGASTGAGASSPAVKPPTFGSVAGGIVSNAIDTALRPVTGSGVIPPSGTGLPPPACPDGMECAPSAPVSHVAPPPPMGLSQKELERWSVRQF